MVMMSSGQLLYFTFRRPWSWMVSWAQVWQFLDYYSWMLYCKLRLWTKFPPKLNHRNIFVAIITKITLTWFLDEKYCHKSAHSDIFEIYQLFYRKYNLYLLTQPNNNHNPNNKTKTVVGVFLISDKVFAYLENLQWKCLRQWIV